MLSAFDALATGVLMVDEELNLVYCNQWVKEHFKHEADALLGKHPLIEAFPEIKASRILRAIEDCFRTGLSSYMSRSLSKSPFDLKPTHAQQSGFDRIQHSISIKAISNEQGPAACLIQIDDETQNAIRERRLRGQDTELRQIAKQSIADQEKLEAIFGAVEDGLIISDVTGKIVMVNPAVKSIFGYEQEELVGQHIEILMPREHARKHSHYMARGKYATKSSTLNRRRTLSGLRADGSEFPIDLVITNFKLHDETMVVAVTRDITLQIEREEQLQVAYERIEASNLDLRDANDRVQEEAARHIELSIETSKLKDVAEKAAKRFEILAEAAPYPIAIFTQSDTRLLYSNDHMTNLFSAKAGDRFDLLRERFMKDKSGLHDVYARLIKNGQIVDEEILLDIPGRGERWILTSVIPIEFENSDCYYICLNDITERKDYEQSLLIMQGELEAARTEAVRANTAKSAFLANMSHEIRTPMNGIIGLCQVLSRMNMEDDQKDMMNSIAESSSHLLSLINDILDISRIESGQLTLSEKPFVLSELISSSLNPIRNTAREKGVLLALDFDPKDDALLDGDVNRLRQVLINIIGNAMKFTSKGQVILRVEVRTAGVHFEVSDTGIGMTPEALERIFDRFQQADESTTRNFGGSGLGLAISRELVELMGGMITATSEEGKGSVFSFTLPLTAPSASAAVDYGANQIAAATSGNSGRLDILVAEDNRISRQVIKASLESFGHAVTLTHDGQEALDALEKYDFDLIIMDSHMPHLSGSAATQRIRDRCDWKAQLPVLCLTANAMGGVREESLAAGADEFMTKPFDEMELLQLVLKMGEKGRTLRPVQEVLPPSQSSGSAA